MKDILEFLKRIDELKHVTRKGWTLVGVPTPESVASHSYMCALLTYMFADESGVNVDKAIKMALVHDLGESITGDITPHDEIPTEQKHQLEQDAIKKLCDYANSNELMNIWKEYEQRNTPEAIFVYEIDRLEMAIQAYVYETKHPDKNFDEFWNSTADKIKTPCLKKVYDMFHESRSKKSN